MSVLPWQAEAHSAPERFIVVVGGRRAGKSFFGGREAFAQLCVPNSWVWIAAPTTDLAEKEFRVVWDLVVTRGLIPVSRKSKRELFIECANGSFIECRTEENPDQMIGEGLDLVVVAEAARLKRKTWDEGLSPTLIDRMGRAIFTSTPRGFNWFQEKFEWGTDPERPDWRSFKTSTRGNILLPESEITRLRGEIEGSYQQELDAEFVVPGGLVFPEFNYNVHVRTHQYVPEMRSFLAIDVGTTNPYAILLMQITPDEHIRVIDEIYQTGKTTGEMIVLAEEKWPYALLDVAGNPRRDVDVIVDEAAAEPIAAWNLRGYRAGGRKPGLNQGIEVHRRMLRDPWRTMPITDENPEGIYPRITFDPRCRETIREYGQYRYPDDSRRRLESSSEVPVDQNNHGISAVRYFLAAAFPELFNVAQRIVEQVYPTAAELGIAEAVERMRISDGGGPLLGDAALFTGVGSSRLADGRFTLGPDY